MESYLLLSVLFPSFGSNFSWVYILPLSALRLSALPFGPFDSSRLTSMKLSSAHTSILNLKYILIVRLALVWLAMGVLGEVAVPSSLSGDWK